MNLEALHELVARARAAGVDVSIVEGKGDAPVRELEDQLGVRCPESLKRFYAAYEYLQVGTHEFVWLKDMTVTVGGLRARHPDLPKHYLPVLADGFGGWYYVVCVEQNQAPFHGFGTVVYNPAGTAGVFETVSPDVLHFVSDKVVAAIDESVGG